MDSFKTQSEGLLVLLDRELALLKAGQLADVVALSEEKSNLIRSFEVSLEQEGASISARRIIDAIVKKASECDRHLFAIRNGMRSIITRMENIDHDEYVGSYNQYGNKMPFRGATGNYLKKV